MKKDLFPLVLWNTALRKFMETLKARFVWMLYFLQLLFPIDSSMARSQMC